MSTETAWEALRNGKPVAEHATAQAARRYVQDEVEQRDGDLIDSLAWWHFGDGEELWLRVGGETTASGWAIRPAGGGGRGA